MPQFLSYAICLPIMAFLNKTAQENVFFLCKLLSVNITYGRLIICANCLMYTADLVQLHSEFKTLYYSTN